MCEVRFVVNLGSEEEQDSRSTRVLTPFYASCLYRLAPGELPVEAQFAEFQQGARGAGYPGGPPYPSEQTSTEFENKHGIERALTRNFRIRSQNKKMGTFFFKATDTHTHIIGPTKGKLAMFKCNFRLFLCPVGFIGGLTRWEMGLESRKRICMASSQGRVIGQILF